MSGQISEKPVLQELCELLKRPVDGRSRRRARLHLLDWLGCAAAGAVQPAGKILQTQPAEDVLGRAFAWGGLGNVLEMDDVDKRALLHPGPSIVPAALSVARKFSASYEQILSALVVGYEATIRLGRAVGGGHYAMWHSTGTCGPIGAAAASASLLDLNQDQTAHAMALAISQSAGLWHTRHDPQSMGKQLHTAVAARAGVHAALLAKDGFTGPLNILEGPQGFFAAMCPDGDVARILDEAETDWSIHDVSFKPWPACRHAHAVIDAALDLRSNINLEEVSDIIVQTYDDALKFCDRAHPKTVIEAKFSLQHAVAIALVRGAPTLEDFEAAAFRDAKIAAWRDRVHVKTSPSFDAVYPARFGASVSIGANESTTPDALGDPENPMSEGQIVDKAEMLMRAGDVPSTQQRELIEVIMTGDHSRRDFLPLISEVLS